MKINITKKEYRLLLDILSIADWVMNSYKVKDDPKAAPYKELEQKFLAFAKNFGFDNLVMYDKKMGKYYPTAEYEEIESDSQFIDEFENESFWDKLCTRLAQRDLLQEKGIDVLKKMEPLDRITEEDVIAEKYENEFIKNGLKNLIISDD